MIVRPRLQPLTNKLVEAAVLKIANRRPTASEVAGLVREETLHGELALYQRLSRDAAKPVGWDHTITLPTFNRPHLLQQVLESLRVSLGRLRRKNPDYAAKWGLVISAEPSLSSIRQALSVDFMPVRVLVNQGLRGLRSNLFNALDSAFAFGSRFNLHLEDDVVLSPAAFDLVYWYERTFRARPGAYFSYSLFADSVDLPLDATGLRHLDTFEGYAWCVFAEVWHEHIRSNWFVDDGHPTGWDWQMRRVCTRKQMKSLAPRASRSNHIGRTGTYCSPEHYDRRFARVKMYEAGDVEAMAFDEPKG